MQSVLLHNVYGQFNVVCGDLWGFVNPRGSSREQIRYNENTITGSHGTRTIPYEQYYRIFWPINLTTQEEEEVDSSRAFRLFLLQLPHQCDFLDGRLRPFCEVLDAHVDGI